MTVTTTTAPGGADLADTGAREVAITSGLGLTLVFLGAALLAWGKGGG